ncbi:MAG: hypothetical protein ACKKMV_01605 [Candidatus Nealsonbacteria bacterium]
MYKDIKFNKKKIVVSLIEIIIFVLVGVNIGGLTQKVYAASTSYDFSSGSGVNKWFYYGKGYANDVPVAVDRSTWAEPGVELASYTTIESANDVHEIISDTTEVFKEVVHDFVITINENPVDIDSIELYWEGYAGQNEEDAADNDLRMYLYNVTTGWEFATSSLDGSCSGPSDCTLTHTITANFSNYIDGSGHLRYLVQKFEQGDACDATCHKVADRGTYYPPGCAYYTDNYQDPTGCAETCRACQSGVCAYANVDSDPGEKCEADEETEFCRQRGTDGFCNGLGACNSYVEWENINEGEVCLSGEAHCSGNTYYSGYACNAGDCNANYGDSGCCQGSKCAAGYYCKESNHTCTGVPVCQNKVEAGYGTTKVSNNTQVSGCNGTCQACQNGGCAYANKESDPGEKCSAGSSTTNGCRLGYCSGSGASCYVASAGDAGCPSCYTCSDYDIACEYKNGHYDAGCTACHVCSNGLCLSSIASTGWGDSLYGCVGGLYRCYIGVCRGCGDGGVVYGDGCSGCAGQGGKACWRRDKSELGGLGCGDVCSSYGGCVDKQWDDNSICRVCRHLFGYSADCDPSSTPGNGIVSPMWANSLGDTNRCRYRGSSYNQDCSAGPGPFYWRVCVCKY